jgi:kynurenine formamidase
VDLSQPLFNGMPQAVAHGQTRFWIDEIRTTIPTGENVARVTHLEMAAHVGTHVDAAIHFVPGGKTITEYPLEAFSGPGVVLDVRRDGVVPLGPEELEAARPAIQPGDFVLLWFGYAERYRDAAAYADHPYLTADAADWLLDRGIRLLGTDTITPDVPGPHREAGFDFPVHKRLLGRDVLIVENLGTGLSQLAGKRVEVRAAPFAIEGGDASPIVPLARALPQ